METKQIAKTEDIRFWLDGALYDFDLLMDSATEGNPDDIRVNLQAYLHSVKALDKAASR